MGGWILKEGEVVMLMSRDVSVQWIVKNFSECDHIGTWSEAVPLSFVTSDCACRGLPLAITIAHMAQIGLTHSMTLRCVCSGLLAL